MSLPESSRPIASQEHAAPAATAKEGPGVVGRRIEYLRSVRFVFEHPDWFKGLLLLAVFMLIPVLSQPMLFGYVYEVVEHLHRRLPGPYPVFEIRRFAAYMTRGIWCYLLVNLVATLLIPLFQVVFQGGMFASMAAIQADREVGPLIVGIGAPVVLIGLVVFLLVLSVMLVPLYLRAGLTQDFAQTFNFRWAADFVRRMWLQTLLVNLFSWLATTVLVLLGCALFCYGALVAAALMALAGGHLTWQLYEMYLARGGEPIPLKTAQP